MKDDIILATPTIDAPRLAGYLFWGGFWLNVLFTFCFVGLWLPVLIVYCCGLGQWWAKASASSRRYHLTTDKLIVEEGVFFLKRKSIPLEKITDLSLSQGILERRFDLWRMNVQTASSGHQMPEGNLLGVVDPQAFRREVFEARSRLTGDPLAQPESAGATGGSVEARLDKIENLLERIEQNTRPQA